jgi:16S rRNA (guanine527-N7)-methyltransferase
MGTDGSGSGLLLTRLLQENELTQLTITQTKQFETYLSLFIRWNARMNLSSVRAPDEIVKIHLLESIVCARELPDGISTLLDFGSGGGLPGIPIALCRPEIAVTLAESQGKKAAFLREAVRVLGISSDVFASRAETLPRCFDCVVLRAVDKMAEAVGEAARLVAPSGWLGLMTTYGDMPKLVEAAGAGFSWLKQHSLPGGASRVIAVGLRAAS